VKRAAAIVVLAIMLGLPTIGVVIQITELIHAKNHR
jgi:hypothetical protein